MSNGKGIEMFKVTEENGHYILVNPKYIGFICEKGSEAWMRSPERDEHPTCRSVILYESDKIFCVESLAQIEAMLRDNNGKEEV